MNRSAQSYQQQFDHVSIGHRTLCNLDTEKLRPMFHWPVKKNIQNIFKRQNISAKKHDETSVVLCCHFLKVFFLRYANFFF